MKKVSKIFLFLGILMLISIFFFENNNDEDTIRSKLEKKGLPTPAFADSEKLKSILKKYSD